jgi:hypothetical protein
VPAAEEHGSVPEEGLQRRQGVVNQRIGPYQQAIRARGGEEAEVVWNVFNRGRLTTVYLSMAGARCSLLNTPGPADEAR